VGEVSVVILCNTLSFSLFLIIPPCVLLMAHHWPIYFNVLPMVRMPVCVYVAEDILLGITM